MEKTKDANYYSAAQMRAISEEEEMETRMKILRAALDLFIWGGGDSARPVDAELVNMAETMRAELDKVRKVVIEVSGGVADVSECPPGIEVEIIDHDNLEAEEEEQRAAEGR